MRKITLLGLAVLFLIQAEAQSRSSNSSNYKTALGVKVWNGAGISLKHFLSENAVEAIGYFYRRGFRLTGLYEIHGDIAGAQGLKWYIGPGAHIGFYGDKYSDGVFADLYGVLGLDYRFSGAPITISLYYQPSFEFGSCRDFNCICVGSCMLY